jgi:hypothetical protein
MEREIVRFFEGMQSGYFNIYRETDSGEHPGKPSARPAHLPLGVTIGTTGTTKDSNLWMKTLRFMLG